MIVRELRENVARKIFRLGDYRGYSSSEGVEALSIYPAVS
jgi:hypothetical protein